MNTRQIGKSGEELAAAYLESKGYAILRTNYVFDHCEIDLIAQDQDTLVFVEVKRRKNGLPRLSVDRRKQQRICRAALGYAQTQGKLQSPMRFDVVEVFDEGGQMRLHHIPYAFDFIKGGYFA